MTCFPELQTYTVRPKSVRTDFLYSKIREEDTYLFFIQNKLYWYIYRLLRGHTVYGKRQKISLFRPSLVHQLRLLGSEQQPQSGIRLISFSTWGTGNSLAEVNMESTEGDELL